MKIREIAKLLPRLGSYDRDIESWAEEFNRVMELSDIDDPRKMFAWAKECVPGRLKGVIEDLKEEDEEAEMIIYPSITDIKTAIEKFLDITPQEKYFNLKSHKIQKGESIKDFNWRYGKLYGSPENINNKNNIDNFSKNLNEINNIDNFSKDSNNINNIFENLNNFNKTNNSYNNFKNKNNINNFSENFNKNNKNNFSENFNKNNNNKISKNFNKNNINNLSENFNKNNIITDKPSKNLCNNNNDNIVSKDFDNTNNNKKFFTIFNEDHDNKNSFEINPHINDINDLVISGNKNDNKNSLQNNYSLLTKINEINNKRNYENKVIRNIVSSIENTNKNFKRAKEITIHEIAIKAPTKIRNKLEFLLLSNMNVLALDTDDLGKSKLLSHKIKIINGEW